MKLLRDSMFRGRDHMVIVFFFSFLNLYCGTCRCASCTNNDVLKTETIWQNEILHETKRKKDRSNKNWSWFYLLFQLAGCLRRPVLLLSLLLLIGRKCHKEQWKPHKWERTAKNEKKNKFGWGCWMRYVHEFVVDSRVACMQNIYKNLLTLRQSAHTIFTTAEMNTRNICVHITHSRDDDDDAIYLFLCARECLLLHSAKGNADAFFLLFL